MEAEKSANYVVAVIFSRWTLMEIFDFMEDYLKAEKEQIASARIDRYRTKERQMRESNRTIVLMERSLFQEAVVKGLDQNQDGLDFRISEYTLSDRQYPRENQRANLFLKFPQDIPYKDIDIQLREKLKKFRNLRLVCHDYRLVIPLNSRETGEHKGYGYLNFTKDNLNVRTLVKILLHDSRLYNDQDPDNVYHLSAFWCRDNRGKKRKEKKEEKVFLEENI